MCCIYRHLVLKKDSYCVWVHNVCAHLYVASLVISKPVALNSMYVVAHVPGCGWHILDPVSVVLEQAHKAYCLAVTAAVCSLLCCWLASLFTHPVCYLTELRPQLDKGYAKLSLWKSLAVHEVIVGSVGVCTLCLMISKWKRPHFN